MSEPSTYDPADVVSGVRGLVSAAETIGEHKIRLAVTVGRGVRAKYIVDCRCGWSSPICWSPARANELYAAHKNA